MLIDSHCHLDFPDFAEDLPAVIARAEAAGVQQMVTIGTYLSRAPQVLALAERFPQIWCTIGVHPHHAADELAETTVERLIEWSRRPKVIGLGETGLDYFYDQSPRPQQRESFSRHLQACRATGLPVIVHSRDAEEDTAALLREHAAEGGLTGVIHCFTSSRWLAEQVLELGFHLSLSGILTFRNAEALRQVAAAVPLERLLVETDAPYLAPIPQRGKRNEPAFVAHTAAALATLKGVSAEELARITSANFARLFPRTQALPPCA